MPTERTVVALIDGRLDLETGRLAPRLTAPGPDHATVSLVATTALLLGGDHVAIHVRVGRDQRLVLEDVAATVAYNGRGRGAALDIDIELDQDATLIWNAEPLVLSAGACVARALTVRAAAGSQLLLRDQLVLGRSGEAGGALTCRTRMTYDETPALAEDLALSPDQLDVAILGRFRVLDTAVALGWRPAPAERGTYFELHTPGAIVRDLVTTAHLSSIPAAWQNWAGTI